MPDHIQFWKIKSLQKMTKIEWESLCDQCGLCCLHRVKDGTTGKVKLLAAACRYLDTATCRCRVYKTRLKTELDCLLLSPAKIRRIKQLPHTCAYRLLVEGKKLAWWHPLVSGDPDTVHEAGISVKGKVVSRAAYTPDDLHYYSAGENEPNISDRESVLPGRHRPQAFSFRD